MNFPFPAIMVSLDAEWVDGRHAEVSLPSNENRLLTWQFSIARRGASNRATSGILEAKGPTKRHRISLQSLLSAGLTRAINEGVIDTYPGRIVLLAHFSRADLSTLRDWKNIRRKVDAVRRTFATTTRPLILTLQTPSGPKRLSVIICDTMLLAPAGSSLAFLGEKLGIPKVELPAGYSKDRMDLFKRDCPNEFRRYAITDTIIALRWADRVFSLIEGELGVKGAQPTLGACGVEMIGRAFKDVGANLDYFCGYTRGPGRKRNPINDIADLWPFSANCYHGGLNVAFWVGHSPVGRPVYDHDIRGAYTTAMTLLKVPDWATVRHTTDIDEIAVIDEALTWCRVQFEFPATTRFPCLPVRGGSRGLIFPLTGISWCCGPEIVVARNMGAILTIEAGYRVEWQAGPAVRPFEAFAKNINAIRDRAKKSDDVVLNLLVKEVGNSGYGKIAQAVDTFRSVSDGGISRQPGKRVFDSREEKMKTLPPSRITSPMHAAQITSLVRALLSEELSRVPAGDIVFTATTDGFLTTLRLSDIDCSGPVAAAFSEARLRLTGDRAIWEQKHEVDGVVVVKTRCTYSRPTVDPATAGRPVLARGGYRPEQAFSTPWEECEFWIDLHRSRDFESEMTRRHLIPLRAQWIEDADLISLTRTTRLNLDFDWKRRVISPTDVDGVMSGDTEPWETIDQFDAERDALESWKKSEQRVEKTVADLTDRRQWMLRRAGQQASGSTRQSGRPPLVNAVMRAIARKQSGAPQEPYHEWATLFTQLGFAVSPQTFKDAARRGKRRWRR
jgi:hypothetical protein